MQNGCGVMRSAKTLRHPRAAERHNSVTSSIKKLLIRERNRYSRQIAVISVSCLTRPGNIKLPANSQRLIAGNRRIRLFRISELYNAGILMVLSVEDLRISDLAMQNLWI